MNQTSKARTSRRSIDAFVLTLLLAAVLAVVASPTSAQPPNSSSASPPDPSTAESEGEVSCTGIGCDEAEEGEDSDAEPEPVDNRTRIEVDVEGGRAVLRAEKFNYQPGEFVVAEGNVEVRYQDLVMKAHLTRFDVATQTLTAEGNVVLDEGPQRLAGDSLEYNIVDRTGRLTNASAHVDPDYYFSGAELAKTGPTSYSVTDGVFTSCEADVPPWSIALSSAKVTLEKYAKIKNARMRFKKVPVFYVPYMLWPAKTERASGFLVPKPGYSSRRGAYLGLAYFQTLGRSADLTLYGDAYSKSYFGGGAELRWQPSENSSGILQGFFITEPTDQDEFSETNPDGEFRRVFDPFRQPGDDRWKISLFHETKNLWKNWRGVVAYNDYSDFDYQGDYERDVRRRARPFIYSNAYLSGNFGNQSVNIMVDRRERILNQRVRGVDLRHQLPEVEYRMRPTQLGSAPVYFSLLSSFNAFRLESDVRDSATDEPRETPTLSYERADLLPIISIPVSTLPWLSVKLDIGGRITHYTDSLNATRTELSGDSLTRSFGTAGVEIVGPSLSRIFDKKLGRFAKFKHVFEPRVNYLFVDDFEDQDLIPSFDEVDPLRPQNVATVSLINRLIAKPETKVDEEGNELPTEGAFEIASFELAQSFSLDDELPLQTGAGMLISDESPIFARLRFNPSRRTSVKADAVYNTLFDSIQSTSVSGGVALGKYSEVGLRWFDQRNPATGLSNRNQAQLFLKFALVPNRLFLDTVHRFDLRSDEEAIVDERVLDQYFRLRWEGSCFTMQFEYSESNFQNSLGEEFRFSLTLKHVGTFLELNAL